MLRQALLLPAFVRTRKPPHALSNGDTLLRRPTVCTNASVTTTPISPPHLNLTQSQATSAYVHLPFCRKRCHYCDFPIVALGLSAADPITGRYDDDPRISNYISLVLREIAATASASASSSACAFASPHPPLETVYFGGGTPSLVPSRLVEQVLGALESAFGVRPDAEMSMEMDPGTFDAGTLEELKGLGVNRVSLGVQAFQEELLRGCGRAHGLKEVREAIGIVTGAGGLENWSLDLISSLPHQTKEMWAESLREAVSARPAHLSVYDLQVEQGTKFGNLYTPGEFPLPTDTDSAEFYRMASTILSEAGYQHYEISSYSKEDRFQSRHNNTYWDGSPFYAFGLGAASYIGGVRFSRPRRMRDYSAYVQKLEDGELDQVADQGLAVADDAKDLAMDVVMLSLRTARGLDVRGFAQRFGRPMVRALFEAFEPYLGSGHVVAMDDRRRPLPMSDFKDPVKVEVVAIIRLSDPEGFLLSNELISNAFVAMSR